MSEKLASTEIAQSRERILKLCPAYWQCGTVAAHWCVICQALEQAERDTRERIAQQLTDFVMEAAKIDSGKWPITARDILELAERIRGKV